MGESMRIGDLVRLNTDMYVDELNRIGVIVRRSLVYWPFVGSTAISVVQYTAEINWR